MLLENTRFVWQPKPNIWEVSKAITSLTFLGFPGLSPHLHNNSLSHSIRNAAKLFWDHLPDQWASVPCIPSMSWGSLIVRCWVRVTRSNTLWNALEPLHNTKWIQYPSDFLQWRQTIKTWQDKNGKRKRLHNYIKPWFIILMWVYDLGLEQILNQKIIVGMNLNYKII